MKIVSLIGLFWLMVFCNFTTAKEETTMQTPSAIPPQETNKMPPWEVHLISQKEFIEISEKLIRQIKTPQDLTLERIESITGLKFETNHNGRAMYIYAMSFGNNNEGTFILSVEHQTEKLGIIRPRFSISTSISDQNKPFVFNPIKLFQPIMTELGYEETPNLYPIARDGYEYETGEGKNRLIFKFPYYYDQSQAMFIEAEERTQFQGWPEW